MNVMQTLHKNTPKLHTRRGCYASHHCATLEKCCNSAKISPLKYFHVTNDNIDMYVHPHPAVINSSQGRMIMYDASIMTMNNGDLVTFKVIC